jgi:acetyl esterase/lipase
MNLPRPAARSVLRAGLPVLLGWLFLSPAKLCGAEGETPRPPAGVRHHPDLIFARAGSADLKLDLACPAEGDGPFPAVIVLHGGGWCIGTRRTYLPTVFDLAARGYVAVTIDYRLTSEGAAYPAQLEDARSAVRWLRANAQRYRIDPQRIGAVGYSSGGQLALMLGTLPEGKPEDAEPSDLVRTVVAFYPPTDLSAWYRDPKVGPTEGPLVRLALDRFLGGPPEKQAERYAAASPITHLNRTSAPTLLIHGLKDTMVPPDQSMRYALKAAQVGAPVRLLCTENCGHDSGWDGPSGDRANAAAWAFLEENLKVPVARN